MGRGGKCISIASQQGTVVLTGDPEDIGLIGLLLSAAGGYECYKQNKGKGLFYLHLRGIYLEFSG
jgi:hypothetical protein